ncbi:WD40/YVTN/BNR-like repeat-containing protein [Dyella flagellata]|uniref:Carbohydrate-binding protein n=1 Tax=Dyella flagellata TaxID=1867833 RepID=A0ABQ5X702_9GAMM|nr:sialidase family protein [Dyella flagellata]GLQ87389.1 carbohydrate-binding protein [Dyella flagellata]
MKKLLHRAIAQGLFCGTLAALSLSAVTTLSAQTTSPSYTWDNARIVAGGYVDGIIAHPRQPGLFYARTDVGGAYRYNAFTGQWVSLSDWTSPADSQWMGIESIAIDPNNPHMLYLVAGLYTQWWGANGAILVSSDQGAHFTAHPLNFRVGGNDDGRNVGERLQVDPNKGSILFYGTFNDSAQASTNGLWTSTDSGSTWTKVIGFNALSSDGSGAGVAFIAFYKHSGHRGSPTKTVFAGVSTKTATSTLYKSTDGGVTWLPVSGGPSGLLPQRGLIGPDGNLYVTYGNAIGPNGMTAGQVWKYNIGLNTWQNITPSDKYNYPSGFSGLAVDSARPGTVVVMSMDHWWPSDTMYRTINGGSSWTDVGANAVRDASLSPWIVPQGQTQAPFGNWGEVVIDPFNSAHAMYGTGGGIWGTFDLTAADAGKATHWHVGANGIEETAVLAMISPTAGAPLISGLGDVCGFVHASLTVAPSTQVSNPVCGNGTGLDFAKNAPSTIVRVGTGGNNVFGSVSSDGGKTWTAFANQAGSSNGGGTVAVSADGDTIVWAPTDVAPVASTDHGTTWTTLTYPSASGATKLPTGAQVLSDGANANLFYAWNPASGTFFSSSDKGVTWYASATSGLPTVASWQKSQAVTVTSVQGDIWLATPSGLYRSTSSGWSWSQVDASTVTTANSIGFGKAAVGKYYPTIYLSGTVNGVTGLFRSTDIGASWVQINDAQHQWGGVSLVVGDPRTFGTVYLGTNGARGVIYGTSPN